MWRSAVSALILVTIAIPSGAHAGVLGDFFASLGSTFAYTTAASYNSQTIPLPEAAQNIDPNPAKGGSEITIVNDSALLPTSGPSGSLADIGDDSSYKNSGQISIYIVRNGDTLSDIAKMFDVSINTIRWGNDIARGESIHPGQELVILPVTGIKYTVKTGGTLNDIIKKYGGDIKEAVAYNGYAADENLPAGTEVIIPHGEIVTPKVTTSRYAVTTAASRGSNLPTYEGYYMRPIIGGVKTQGIHGHNAVDLASSIGTPIMAAASGKVIVAKSIGWNGGYGSYVVIQHDNDTQTLYAHASKVLVSRGQRVVQGQVIEYMGSTGKSTGSHLHFEIRGARNPF